MTADLQPWVQQDMDREQDRLVRSLIAQGPNWPSVAITQTNREIAAANAYADKHSATRAAEYRRDPLKCATLLADWLHEPEGRKAIAVLTAGDWCEFGNRSIVALDAACKAAARQDLMDEQLLGESK